MEKHTRGRTEVERCEWERKTRTLHFFAIQRRAMTCEDMEECDVERAWDGDDVRFEQLDVLSSVSNLYLHEVCSPSTIHKNIKSSNILLDIELNSHLSDCGLASFYQETNKTLGPGYQPPEYNKPSDYTMKSDVYCFGVVMLELLTGRKPFDSSKPRPEQTLVRWAMPQLHDIGALAQMVDPALRGLYSPKSLSRFADVIALCVQPEPEFRPPMSEVVQALVLCVQRSSISKKIGGELSTSRQSDDSDYYY